MVSDVLDVNRILLKKSLDERLKFEKLVTECMYDKSWLKEYHLPDNPKRELIRQTLCKILYC